MKLYSYFRSSAAYRVRIALNLKGLDPEYISVHLVKNGGEQHSPEYRQINPTELIPAWIEKNIPDEFTLTQSLSILEYLEEKYPDVALLPQDFQQRALIRAVSQSIACDIHPLNNLRVLQYLSNTLAISDEQKTTWYRHSIETGFKALEIQLKNLILAEDIEKCEENIELFKQQYLHNQLVLEVFKRQEDDIKKLYKYNYDIRKLLYQYYAIREIKRHINRLNERQPLQENIDDVIEHFTEYISSFERGLTYSKKGWVRLMNILYEIYPKKMEEYL